MEHGEDGLCGQTAGMRSVYILPAGSFSAVATKLAALRLDDGDLVLTHPLRGARLVGGTDDIASAHEVFGDAIAVAAGTEPGPGGEAGTGWLEAVVALHGSLPYRPHPQPLALCGPAGALAALVADCAAGQGNDAERLAGAISSGNHDVALDVGGQVFRVLDGTGTDVVVVAGRLHAGSERPVALIDPTGGPRLEPVDAALRDEGTRDLAAILRYEGAAAPAGEVLVAAPEILVVPLWTEEFCGSVIRAAEAAGVWSSDADDPVPGVEVSLYALSPRLVGLLEEDLAARVWPQLQAHWGEVAVTPVHDAFVVRYEPGGDSAGLGLHHDVAQVSASVRLNDGYEGGALAFPRQDWDTAGIPVGHLVAWPSLVTHPHRADPVSRGVKYGLTIWFALPGT